MNCSIIIKDKPFKPFIKHADILTQVKRIAEELNHFHKDDFPLFLVILNGSFMFASDLLREVNIPCEISFVKFTSYQGTQSSERVNELIGLNEDLFGRNVVVIEDIVDTGHTIEKIMNDILTKGARAVKVATAFFKPGVYAKDLKIDYIGFEIPNNFVVGYGLDYDGLGRNLKDLHVLV
ncbi:MAG: phosphoribosyltransferase family protein [Bacteroidota bacterium]